VGGRVDGFVVVDDDEDEDDEEEKRRECTCLANRSIGARGCKGSRW
jgi:hypothetical protein